MEFSVLLLFGSLMNLILVLSRFVNIQLREPYIGGCFQNL